MDIGECTVTQLDFPPLVGLFDKFDLGSTTEPRDYRSCGRRIAADIDQRLENPARFGGGASQRKLRGPQLGCGGIGDDL